MHKTKYRLRECENTMARDLGHKHRKVVDIHLSRGFRWASCPLSSSSLLLLSTSLL